MEELRPLWTFIQVARHGTLTAAADALALSNAAISKSIGRLEQQLGLKLFSRSSRSVRLTDDGRRLFEQLEHSFDTIETVLQQIRQGHSVPAGNVQLSSVTVVGRDQVVPLLPLFLERYPLVNVILSLHDGARGMSRHTYDVRINWGEDHEQGKVAHRLFDMPLVMVASPAYLTRRGTPEHPSDLNQHDCISTRSITRQPATWYFTPLSAESGSAETLRFEPRGRILLEDELEAVAAAAVAGLGVTMICADNIANALASGAVVPILSAYRASSNELQTDIVLQHAPRKDMSPAACALVDFLVEHLKRP